MALIEDHYFTQQKLDREYYAPWSLTGGDDAWEWSLDREDTPLALRELWLRTVARFEAALNQKLAIDVLERPRSISNWSKTPRLTRILIDLIEE